MRLGPTERDRLLIFGTAELARARRARGLRLNVPEATALIADTVCEAARDGLRLAEAIAAGRAALAPDDVLPGVADVLTEIQVEAVFEDGSRLAVLPFPLRSPDFPLHSPDPTADGVAPGSPEGARHTAPGAVLPAGPEEDTDAAYAPRAAALSLPVRNTAAVPVSVTSHFHFFEANPRLEFDRAAAYGMRLAVPAGSSVRFDPDGTRTVGLVPLGGDRTAIGFAGLVDGPLDAPGARTEALRRAAACGYLGAAGSDAHREEGEA
ncbi:urease subunit gamma [Streptomyces sp. WMMB303]|uniref:urease subunit gamma n=1 Tax=Streptomyces sp. WMMB303 TaxID=3034154 RepID=UPI0023EC34F3|nr:urease subunit gamma [Streptomyces sp. WMMB303]MDF4253228.1 urease subunit gamma [Streptomyces sp. WMMB303]